LSLIVCNAFVAGNREAQSGCRKIYYLSRACVCVRIMPRSGSDYAHLTLDIAIRYSDCLYVIQCACVYVNISSQVHYNLGRLASDAGDEERAIKKYRTAVRLNFY
jgi:hypothetical protein